MEGCQWGLYLFFAALPDYKLKQFLHHFQNRYSIQNCFAALPILMHSKKIKKTLEKKCNKALIKKCEKYNWEFILIIRKIQVIRVVKKNLETNSN